VDLVRRSAWGARPPKGRPLAIALPVRYLVLHHSVTPDEGADTVRSIQRFHQDTRRWSDMGYSWLYSPRDRVFFEGRGLKVAQAAQSGHNRDAHSVCVLGNYERDPVPAHALDDLAAWADWHAASASGPGVYIGHRDVGDTATACPGRNLYNLLGTINGLATGERPAPIQPGVEIPPTVRRGDRGDDVRLAQAGVGATVDGIFGPRTEAMVRAFQSRHRLASDGIVGPKTWQVILA
jgi:peptidoglycan hydrolase-like protein with peptidoglycan-binding domain